MKKYIIVLFFSILLVFFFSCNSGVSVDVAIKGEGVVNVYPEASEYAEGAEVVLEAVSGDYSDFAGWTGDINSQQNPVALELGSSKSVTALFPLLEGFEREVYVYQKSKRSLSIGEKCEFTIDLDLPEGQEYRVWIYPDSSTISSASSYKYKNSSILAPTEKDIIRYGYLVDANSESTSGACTHWYVDIASWDGSANTNYALYRFEYPVTWQ